MAKLKRKTDTKIRQNKKKYRNKNVDTQKTYLSQDIMTVKEVANYMRVHSSTIYRLVREDNIPAFKVGNQWRFRKNLIDKWLEKQALLNKKKAVKNNEE